MEPENTGAPAPPDERQLDPGQDIAYRYWWSQSVPSYKTWRIHVRFPKTGRQVSLVAGLGLQGNEDRFTGVDRLFPNWKRFAELERGFGKVQRGGCYLAHVVAGELGAVPGDTLVIGGWPVELVGTFDGGLLEDVKDLDDRSLLPVDYTAIPDTQRWMAAIGNSMQSMQAIAIQSGKGLQEDRLPRVPGSKMVILPASMLRSFGKTNDTDLRTIAIRTESVASARKVAEEVGRRMAFPAYYGSPEAGVRILVFVPLLQKVPKSLWILMILAGLIIFNTMMSAIAERKGEIYIYTSMGLAPLHIGVLFLAEAVTYGLMGSVFGYVAGQGVATALGHLGWLGGMSLNYSGTQAIATMVMVVCITVISSIIPAYRAGKLAVPSSKMQWAVPAPVDGV
ncbi:MAG: ABC transporter permease, partial [Candidatus Neomarinimicrobiota bacterium]